MHTTFMYAPIHVIFISTHTRPPHPMLDTSCRHTQDLHQHLQVAFGVGQRLTQDHHAAVPKVVLGQAQVREALVDHQGGAQLPAAGIGQVAVLQPAREVTPAWSCPAPEPSRQAPPRRTGRDGTAPSPAMGGGSLVPPASATAHSRQLLQGALWMSQGLVQQLGVLVQELDGHEVQARQGQVGGQGQGQFTPLLSGD